MNRFVLSSNDAVSDSIYAVRYIDNGVTRKMEHVKTPNVQGKCNICTGKETVSITGSEEPQHNGKKKIFVKKERMEESNAKINKSQGCRAEQQPQINLSHLCFFVFLP